MSDQQQRFDYEREQRERRQLVRAVAFERTGLASRRTWANIQALLVLLVNCDRGSGMIPYVETIANQLHWSRRTADRTIAAAKQLGVLKAETRKNKRGRTSNSWTIDFAALAALGVPQSGVDQRQNGVNQRQSGVNQRQSGVNSRQNGVNPIKRNYHYLIPLESSSSSGSSQLSALSSQPIPRPSTLDPRPLEEEEEEEAEAGAQFMNRWKRALPVANRLLRVLAPASGLAGCSRDMREWISKVALVAVELGDDWIEPAFEQLRYSQPRNPQALLAVLLDQECQRLGTRLNRELARVRLPKAVEGRGSRVESREPIDWEG